MRFTKLLLQLAAPAFLLVSCGGGGGGSSAPVSPPTPPSGGSSNSAPILSSSKEVFFQENTEVSFSVSATDADGDSVTISLATTADSRYFELESGVIKGSTSNGSFDFETPNDQNRNNVYELELTLSDGTDTVTETLQVSIEDEDGPLTCSSGETAQIKENTQGEVYVFRASKPDSVAGLIDFPLQPTVSRATSVGVTERLGVSLSTAYAAEGQTSLKSVLLRDYVNAERHGDLDVPYLVEAEANIGEETAMCSVFLEVVDVETEVTSGLKIAGRFDDAESIRSFDVADIDGDGLAEMWISSTEKVPNLPPNHYGHLIFGDSIRTLNLEADKEVLLENLNQLQSVTFSGSFPSVHPLRYIGNNLISRPIGDVDGDGIAELLLLLETPYGALESAFVERPHIYLIWGDAVLNAPGGRIDLNTLSPNVGVKLEGLGGLDRKGHKAISGDFDGDSIPDIVLSLPFAKIEGDNSVYRGQIFIIFGSFLQELKGESSFDLLDDFETQDPNKVIILTVEDENEPATELPDNPVFIYSGEYIEAVPDLDGDGANELAINGQNTQQYLSNYGVISSMAIKEMKGVDALVDLYDIKPNHFDNILLRLTQGNSAPYKFGDFDGDGLMDFLVPQVDATREQPILAIVRGSLLQANTSRTAIRLYSESLRDGIVFLDYTSDSISVNSASFIGDIDGDSRDDIGISIRAFFRSDSGDYVEDFIAIVLAKSLDGLANGETYAIDQMVAGDGLYLTNATIQQSGITLTVHKDMDGDSYPDLSIHDLYGSNTINREALIVPSEELRAALSAGEIIIDLAEKYRAVAHE